MWQKNNKIVLKKMEKWLTNDPKESIIVFVS